MKLEDLTQKYVEDMYNIEFNRHDHANSACYKLRILGLLTKELEDSLNLVHKEYEDKCQEVATLVTDRLPSYITNKFTIKNKSYFPISSDIAKNNEIKVILQGNYEPSGHYSQVYIHMNVLTGKLSFPGKFYVSNEVINNKPLLEALEALNSFN